MKKTRSSFLKLYILLTLLFFLYIFLFVYFFVFERNKVCYNSTCFTVEIADTESKRRQGLMFRDNLGENKGMLFVYSQEDIYSFWMKNTIIPLDLVWIDSDFRVVDMTTLYPCEDNENCEIYTPTSPAKYVLEINIGNIDKLDITSGSLFYFDI